MYVLLVLNIQWIALGNRQTLYSVLKIYVILTQLVNMIITVLLSFPDLGYNFAELGQIKDSCLMSLYS